MNARTPVPLAFGLTHSIHSFLELRNGAEREDYRRFQEAGLAVNLVESVDQEVLAELEHVMGTRGV